MSAEEVAHAVATWAGRVDPALSRRALLLKLSAGLSLAAADPALTTTQELSGKAGKKLNRSRISSASLAGSPRLSGFGC